MKKKLFLLVLSIHLVGILFLLKEKTTLSTLPKPLSIKTTIIKPKKSAIVKSTPKIKPSVLKKKALKKKSIVAKKKSKNPIVEQLQKKIKKIQIEDNEENLFIPKAISFDTKILSNIEHEYKEKLASFFSSNLTLPDRGKVKVFLKISSEGKLLECKILHTESQENQQYLKNQLHHLNYPCFNGEYKSIVICFSDV